MPMLATLTDRLKAILEQILKNGKSPQALAKRAQMIHDCHRGISKNGIAILVGKSRSTVHRRVERWQEKVQELTEMEETVDDVHLAEKVREALSDAPKSGAPPKYTIEQITKVVALACEPPEDSGRPISHWTLRELADEAQERGIVESISVGAVGHLLREADVKPHRIRYWLNAKPEDPEIFDKQVREICGLYQKAPELAARGEHLHSVDEKCGIQALERCHPDRPVQPGRLALLEFEYRRRGTQTLIASFDVATGTVLGSIGDTRSEIDFLNHVIRTVDTDPEAKWTFILDQLSTHKSESLVRFVAERCGIDEDLGVKGKSGVLKNRHTRAEFLTDAGHRVRFVYTPKHASWLNQIEIWFSILCRKLLRRASFTSTEELRTRVLEFIEYFNKTMAKPFKWTYKGRVLQV